VFIRKRILIAAILVALIVAAPSAAPAAAPGPSARLPGVAPELEDARFWIAKLADADKLILTPAEIAAFNRTIRAKSSPLVFDLAAYPRALEGRALSYMLRSARVPAGPVYSGGQPVPASFFADLRGQINLDGLKETNPVRYGFAVARAGIRRFPTARGVFAEPGDDEFDLFQETIVDPAEPLLILHASRDGRWHYVQTRNYRGWLAAGDVAVAPGREAWLAYVSRPDFLVVTGKSLRVDTGKGSEPLLFEMGARLPLAAGDSSGRRVELPARSGDGTVVFRQIDLPEDADVSRGYLPFTRANILRQALKLKDVRYGWGGLYEGVDCSALVMDVYRTFGVILPRNADQQLATAGRTENLRGLPPAEKNKKIQALGPGAALFTAYHAVLCLGRDKGRAYVIHALPAWRDPGSQRRVAVMRVVVSDLALPLSDGRSLLDALIGGKQLAGN
jgi:hypothetical protein